MEWYNILGILLGGGGIISSIVMAYMNRRVTRAQALQIESQAKTGNADYADKIIEQANERVSQALADRDRALKERDDAYIESKAQRKAKQEWREKYNALVQEKHTLELDNKDLLAKLNEADWHRCEVNGCGNRVPPRTRNKKEEENK